MHNVLVSDLVLMINVMNNFSREFDTLVESFEREMGSMSSKFSTEKMNDELYSKHNRWQSFNFDKEDRNFENA